MKSLYRAVALTLALGFTTSACYGKFMLTRKVYEINGQITDNKFVHSLVMWVFMIVPVYPIAGFADVVILNLIEFWTGSNPMQGSVTSEDGTTVTIERGTDTLTLTATKDGKVLNKVVFVKSNGKVEAVSYDAAGKQLDHKTFASIEQSAEAFAAASL